MPELYGYAPLLEELVPRLVGLQYRGRRRVDFEHRRRTPVIRLIGGRATGKTALLRELSAAYSQRIPQAYADVADPGLAEPGTAGLLADHTPNASRVTDLLYILSYQLRRTARGFSRPPLTFPRLLHGLLAVTSWQAPGEGGADGGDGGGTGGGPPPRPAELVAAEKRLAVLLRGGPLDRDGRLATAKEWIDAVNAYIGGAPGMPPGLGPVVQGTIAVVARKLLTQRAHRGAFEWWAKRGVRPVGNGLEQLVALAGDFRDEAGGGRRLAEGHLVAALLEDVAANYGTLRERNAVPRALALLDNAHTPLGEEFHALLLEAHHDAALGDRRVRLVVVTAGLGDERRHRPLESVARASGWAEPEPSTPEAWQLGLGLPSIGLREIRSMFGEDASPGGLAPLILRFSAGRTGVADALVRAAVRGMRTSPAGTDAPDTPTAAAGAPRPTAVPPEELLDLPAADRPAATVTTHLVEHLIPDPLIRRRLLFFAPALDDDAAQRLSRELPVGDSGGLPVQEVKEYLRRNAWSHRAWPGMAGPFVGDPALRALLLHELRVSADSPGAGADAWLSRHRRLRALYDPQGVGPGAAGYDVRALHHCLALGETDAVVCALHRRFAGDGPRDWLAALNLVCAAPRPPAAVTGRPYDIADVAEADAATDCPPCASDGQHVHQAFALLVRDLWRMSDPLAVPDHEVIERIEHQLTFLAQQTRPAAAQEIVYRAQKEWPERLRRGEQAPGLPVPEGGGI